MFKAANSNGKQPVSGAQMLFRAMGIEFDLNALKEVAGAVIEVRDTMRRIEEKQDRILLALRIAEGRTLPASEELTIYGGRNQSGGGGGNGERGTASGGSGG